MARVYLSLGSNIEAEQHIRSAINVLHERYNDMIVSTIFESEAVGFEGDNFLNLVVGFDTLEDVHELDEAMSEIENAHGRLRGMGEKFAARTLDIDLLMYDDLVLEGEDLQLPRYEIDKYAFVLLPLSEIAPELIHPVIGLSMEEMWQMFDKTGQGLWAVDFEL